MRTSPYTFTRLAGPSQLFFVTQGYAVLDDATMPVVGDPETMNDTYVEQISAAARAAIETLDKKGVIDPKRVGVGGHSYGAFMTANLLAHTDLFAAGIARSGAYNRSLTPFGFQTERRSYWEATDLYTKMSPFTYAHKINEPILLIHGEADNNSGTFPIQSERLFQAIKGNGGTARLVLLPHESHGYRARESVLHVLAEMFEWADRYVKNRSDSAGSSARGETARHRPTGLGPLTEAYHCAQRPQRLRAFPLEEATLRQCHQNAIPLSREFRATFRFTWLHFVGYSATGTPLAFPEEGGFSARTQITEDQYCGASKPSSRSRAASSFSASTGSRRR